MATEQPAGDHRRATPHPKMPFKCKPSAPRVFLRQQGASLVNGQALKFSQRVAGGKTAELAELQNITVACFSLAIGFDLGEFPFQLPHL